MVSRPSLFGYNGIKAQAPRNQGMSKIAQARLDATVAAANQQFENALAADGTEIVVWTKKSAGRYCTCQHLEPSTPLFTADPVATTVDTYQQKPDIVTFKIRGGKGRAQQRENPDFLGTDDSRDAASGAKSLQSVDINQEQQTLDNGQQSLTDALALLNAGDDSGFLYGGDRTPCGICFSTGYVEGYQMMNGHRYVLDASDVTLLELTGFTINKETFPYTFESEFSTNNIVQWDNIELPTYFIKCLSVHCRNNTKIAESIVIEININGGGWVVFTTDLINQRNGLNNMCSIRVRPIVSQLEGVIKFTHIDFTLQYAPNYLAQVPPETPTWADISKARALVNTTISISSRAVGIKSFDIVFVYKTNSLYKVNDVTDFSTSKNQSLGTNGAGIRLLQSYEVETLLRLVFNPVRLTGFTGLEQVQAHLLYKIK